MHNALIEMPDSIGVAEEEKERVSRDNKHNLEA